MAAARASVQRLLPRSELAPQDATDAREARDGRERAAAAPATAGLLRGPLGVAEILDLSIELFLRRFGVQVGVVAALLLPLHLAAELWNLALPLDLLLEAEPDVAPGLLAGRALVLMALGCVPWGLARVFVVSLAGGECLGRAPSVSRALGDAFARWPGILLLSVVTSLATTLGLCACILPVVLAVWLFEPALPAFTLEARAPGDPRPGAGRGLRSLPDALRALSRGRTLASGGPTFLRWLACTAASFVFALPFLLQVQDELGFRDALDAALPGPLVVLVLALAVSLQQSVALAFRSVVVTVFYLDQRVRKEGLDLELLLERARADALFERGHLGDPGQPGAEASA